MKKKFLLLTALLAVSAACFAGCTDNNTKGTNSTTREQNTKIVLTDEEKPNEKKPEENIHETEEPSQAPDKDESPDGKCPPKSMPCPRHNRRHPRPIKDNK